MLFYEPSRGMQFKHIARSMAQEYFHSEPRQQRRLEKVIKGDTRSGKIMISLEKREANWLKIQDKN